MPKRQLVPQFKLNEKGLARFFGTLEARIMDAVWTLTMWATLIAGLLSARSAQGTITYFNQGGL